MHVTWIGTRRGRLAGSFARTLVRREVLTLSFGAMIGWSWVLLTGEWLIRAGSLGAVLAFVVGGVAVIFISLTYAELAAAMPKAVVLKSLQETLRIAARC